MSESTLIDIVSDDDYENYREYVFTTIPREYICIYHHLLVLLADYGEEMLKDCKASCKDRNKDVIECYNMFNAAVAAKRLAGQTGDPAKQNHYNSLANTLKTYIQAKLEQLYGGTLNTSFVFPVDANGEIKAIVDCAHDKFYIDATTGELYKTYYDSCNTNHYVLVGENNEYLAIENNNN